MPFGILSIALALHVVEIVPLGRGSHRFRRQIHGGIRSRGLQDQIAARQDRHLYGDHRSPVGVLFVARLHLEDHPGHPGNSQFIADLAGRYRRARPAVPLQPVRHGPDHGLHLHAVHGDAAVCLAGEDTAKPD